MQVKVNITQKAYYLEGWNIYWERVAVSLSAQRMCVSNACNTEFCLFVILGNESIHLIMKGFVVTTYHMLK